MNEINCAECKKAYKGKKFPYEDGWKYIFQLQWKEEQEISKMIRDKQFCSVVCLFTYLKKLIQ